MSTGPRGTAVRAAIVMAVIGVGIGAGFGLLTATGVDASGLPSVNLPPLNSPTSTATLTPSPSPTTAAATSAAPEQPKAEISTPATTVAPNQKIALSGRIPTVASGTVLQVQVKDGKAAWQNFGVAVTAREGGTFTTWVITSRTGVVRSFRLLDPKSGDATPGIAITIT